MKPRRTWLWAAVTLPLLLVSCRYEGPSSLPLPAGTSAGSDPYRVTVVFDDATNLARKGSCRANDVPVGTIESITLDAELRARVVCLVNRETGLPANAVGTLSETSLLGERFVALGPPLGDEPKGKLRPGSVIEHSGNHINPNVEQVLGALSAVLNGGSLARIQTITRELNEALSGREPEVRAVLGQLATLTGHLNQNRGDITRALDSLDTVTGTLARQKKVLGAAIDAVPDGLEVLNRQRPKLITLLDRLSRLSDVATPVIEQSRRDTVADLELLRPILAELDKAGGDLAEALGILLSYPFPSKALSAMQGDFFGLNATFNLSLDSVNALLAGQLEPQRSPLGGGSGRPAEELPGLPGLDTPQLRSPDAPALDLGDLLTGGR